METFSSSSGSKKYAVFCYSLQGDEFQKLSEALTKGIIDTVKKIQPVFPANEPMCIEDGYVSMYFMEIPESLPEHLALLVAQGIAHERDFVNDVDCLYDVITI